MRKMTLLVFMCIGASAWGQSDSIPTKIDVPLPGLGQGVISITDIGEPVYAPWQLQVSVVCTDQRVKLVLGARPICAWGGYDYDVKNKTLSVTYGKAAIVAGDSPCELKQTKVIDLKKACAPRSKARGNN